MDPFLLLLRWNLSAKDLIKVLITFALLVPACLLGFRADRDLYESKYLRERIARKVSKENVDNQMAEIKNAIQLYDSNWNVRETRGAAIAQMLIYMQRLIGKGGVFDHIPVDGLRIFVSSAHPFNPKNYLDQHLLLSQVFQPGNNAYIRFKANIADPSVPTATTNLHDWKRMTVMAQHSKQQWSRQDLIEEMSRQYISTELESVPSSSFEDLRLSANKNIYRFKDNLQFPPDNLAEEEAIRAIAEELNRSWERYNEVLNFGMQTSRN